MWIRPFFVFIFVFCSFGIPGEKNRDWGWIKAESGSNATFWMPDAVQKRWGVQMTYKGGKKTQNFWLHLNAPMLNLLPCANDYRVSFPFCSSACLSVSPNLQSAGALFSKILRKAIFLRNNVTSLKIKELLDPIWRLENALWQIFSLTLLSLLFDAAQSTQLKLPKMWKDYTNLIFIKVLADSAQVHEYRCILVNRLRLKSALSKPTDSNLHVCGLQWTLLEFNQNSSILKHWKSL